MLKLVSGGISICTSAVSGVSLSWKPVDLVKSAGEGDQFYIKSYSEQNILTIKTKLKKIFVVNFVTLRGFAIL